MPAYDKPPLTYDDQVALLRARGLYIDRRQEATHVLRMVGYARLCAYWYPLLADPANGPLFRTGSTFSQIYERYQLDSELRRVTLYAIDHIEVALRARVAYVVSHRVGTGLWLLDESLFTRFQNQIGTVSKILDGLHKSSDAFATEYLKTYGPGTPVPPAWLGFEVLTIDGIVSVYKNLLDRDLRNEISADYDLDQDTLISWLGSICAARNFAAHHARLWNRTVKEPQWPKRFADRGDWIDRWKAHGEAPRYYSVACCMVWMLDRINPKNTFRSRLMSAIDARSQDLSSEMGFPADWRTQPLWDKQ